MKEDSGILRKRSLHLNLSRIWCFFGSHCEHYTDRVIRFTVETQHGKFFPSSSAERYRYEYRCCYCGRGRISRNGPSSPYHYEVVEREEWRL